MNRAAALTGLMFGPDPASADRATFGGMVGNNAAGAHSIRYGMTSDHVLRARVVLGDGSLADFVPVSEAEAQRRGNGSSLEAWVYRTALELRRTVAEHVRRRWPRTWRRSSGYGLSYLTGYAPEAPAGWYRAPAAYVDADRLDLPGAFCGSEGTLGVLVEAEVRLVPRPKATALLLLAFDSVVDACQAATSLLEEDPCAIELIPQSLLDRAHQVPAYSRRLGFLQATPPAMLAVEFEGESEAAALSAVRHSRFSGTVLADASSQAEFWEVRRAGLGLITSVPGDTKPITFIEDVAVPVGALAEYVRRVERILADHATTAEWYGHASAGCIHLRPMVNLKTERGRLEMRQIAEDIVREVLELRGAVSGEHGDGLSHTEFNEQLFGPELTRAFGQWKRAFDPAGILNPGKVVVLESDPRPSINGDLRYRSDLPAPVEPKAIFGFQREQGLLRALEACNGVGVCRKETGVMCPSFQATRQEMDSTRGRANALRAAMSGWLPPETLLRPEMHRVLDLCLECKGCKAECPNAVDMARIKAEYLAWYQAQHGVPFRSRLFGDIARVQAMLARLAPIHNALRTSPFSEGRFSDAGNRLPAGCRPSRANPSRTLCPSCGKGTFRETAG
jgi:FAD/FMN-containing dehydrogenase